MNCSSDERRDDIAAAVSPCQKRMMLCSLRVVPVSSEHFLGRRYVMELATTSRARELRVYRSFELLMQGVAELGLSLEVQEELCRQLCDSGHCDLLNILL